MSLFGPPALRRVVKANPVLEGGRTRLLVAISGWGRLTLTLAAADGSVTERRVRVYGGERELFVDVMPPGLVTIDVRNPFGGDARTLAVKTDLPGIVKLPAPLVHPLTQSRVPAGPVVLDVKVPVVRIPAVQGRDAPRIRLGSIAVKAFHEIRLTENDR